VNDLVFYAGLRSSCSGRIRMANPGTRPNRYNPALSSARCFSKMLYDSLLPVLRVALAMKAGDHDDAGFLHEEEQAIGNQRTPARRRSLSTTAKRSGMAAIASAVSTTALANRSPNSGRMAS
jgi:hypothetical protein